MPHHLGSDSLTFDSTLFCWQRDGETDRQVDRHADSIWCKTGDLWTHVVVRKTLPPELSLSFALSLSPSLGICCVWLAVRHMPIRCPRHCRGSVPPVPLSPTAALQLPVHTLARIDTHLHTETLTLSLHLCPWGRVLDRESQTSYCPLSEFTGLSDGLFDTKLP